MTSADERSWTTPDDVVAVLRRRWAGGALLTAFASGRPWAPIALTIRGPSARDLTGNFADVAAWRRRWAPTARRPWRVESRSIGGRHAGVNALPARVWLDEPGQLWTVLGVQAEVERFAGLVNAADRSTPRLVGWMQAHPMQVLAFGVDWDLLVRTAQWIDESARPGMYLRQVDVPGVDTKFIEAHRGTLAELLDLQLPQARVDHGRPRRDLEGRYGFRRKPAYVRFRPAANDPQFGALAELGLRAEDFLAAAPTGSRVVIIENEVSYLALPTLPDTMVVFGSGYALSLLGAVGWLADRELVYWGDIDTHGFVILDRLRQHWPSARSILMDRATLLAHPTQWVREPTPVAAPLPHLDLDEAALYRDLVEDSFGPSIRLEQERIRFSTVDRAVRSVGIA